MIHPPKPIKQTLCGLVILSLAGCASIQATQPILFQLVDEHSNTYPGSYDPNSRHMDVTINNKVFQGFYIVSHGTAIGTVEPMFSRHFNSFETLSDVTSNSARAYLNSKDGEKITCQFLFEDRRAIGDCKSSFGHTYQFVADGK